MISAVPLACGGCGGTSTGGGRDSSLWETSVSELSFVAEHSRFLFSGGLLVKGFVDRVILGTAKNFFRGNETGAAGLRAGRDSCSPLSGIVTSAALQSPPTT